MEFILDSESIRLTPSEAINAFAAWLTTRDSVLHISTRHSPYELIELVDLFCKTQNLSPPRKNYHQGVMTLTEKEPEALMPPVGINATYVTLRCTEEDAKKDKWDFT